MPQEKTNKPFPVFLSSELTWTDSPSPHKSHWLLHPIGVHPLHIHQPQLQNTYSILQGFAGESETCTMSVIFNSTINKPFVMASVTSSNHWVKKIPKKWWMSEWMLGISPLSTFAFKQSCFWITAASSYFRRLPLAMAFQKRWQKNHGESKVRAPNPPMPTPPQRNGGLIKGLHPGRLTAGT